MKQSSLRREFYTFDQLIQSFRVLLKQLYKLWGLSFGFSAIWKQQKSILNFDDHLIRVLIRLINKSDCIDFLRIICIAFNACIFHFDENMILGAIPHLLYAFLQYNILLYFSLIFSQTLICFNRDVIIFWCHRLFKLHFAGLLLSRNLLKFTILRSWRGGRDFLLLLRVLTLLAIVVVRERRRLIIFLIWLV